MLEAPEEAAAELRGELVEILKFLNRSEMEMRDVNGLEFDEVRHLLARGAYPHLTAEDVERAIEVLVGNGFACSLSDPTYAWDRGRVLGRRYAITTGGKAFLLRQMERLNRID